MINNLIHFNFSCKKAVDNNLYISGIASSNSVDREGEAINILPSALKEAAVLFLGQKPSTIKVQTFLPNRKAITKTFTLPNNGALWYHHGGVDNSGNYFGNRPIGKVTNLEIIGDPFEGLTLEQIISNQTPAKPYQIKADGIITNPDAIDLINSGLVKQFSLSWYVLVKVQNRYTGEEFDVEIGIKELSITPNPVNTEAKFEIVNRPDYKYQVGDSIETANDIYEVVGQVASPTNSIPFYKVRSQMTSKSMDLILPESIFESKKKYTVSLKTKANKDQNIIDETYKKYHENVNMTPAELLIWSRNKTVKMAGIKKSPLTRNLKLLKKTKDDWTMEDIKKANKTITFVSKMKDKSQNQKLKQILMNHGHKM